MGDSTMSAIASAPTLPTLPSARARAATFMAEWLRQHLPSQRPRRTRKGTRPPISIFDSRLSEYRRRMWDALYQAKPETWTVAWSSGPADVEAMVSRMVFEG